MNSLVLKYLFPESQVANFSLKNLIAFTHKQAKQLDFNDFVDSLFTFFGVNGKEEALKDIDGIITELSFAPPVLEGLTF